MLNVFAPRNGAEFRRLLRPDGALVVATPADDHLTELVSRRRCCGWTRRSPNGWRPPSPLVPRRGRAPLTRRLRLTRQTARLLIGMGPSARHADAADLVADLPEPFPVTASVRVTRYRPV